MYTRRRKAGSDYGRNKKKGKPNIAPLNRLPLLPSDPGGIQQELVVPACRGAKVEDILNLPFLRCEIATFFF
jgi:hypothetical protein